VLKTDVKYATLNPIISYFAAFKSIAIIMMLAMA